jgi:hypothetical protein
VDILFVDEAGQRSPGCSARPGGCTRTCRSDLASLSAVAGAEALNSAIASVTEKFGGKVADGFAAFQGPSAASGGSPCAAGLLIKLPDGTCNIHPSPAGHLLLAQAIEDVAVSRAG